MTASLKQNNSIILQIDSLFKSFGEILVLDNVSLSIKQGQFVCFLGASGCGKTTLLRLIAGLETMSSGDIYIDGKCVNDVPVDKRNTSIVFQSYALFPNLTVLQNVMYGLDDLSKQDAIKLSGDLIKMVGMTDKTDAYPNELSGGQQQRVALARALAVKPQILLLDEPLSALDKKIREHLRTQIKSIQNKLGITTVMVTHDQEEAFSMADVIVVINNGRVEQIGSPQEIYNTPATKFVVDFIGNMSILPPSITGGIANVSIRGKDCITKKYTKTGKGHSGVVLSTEFLGARKKLRIKINNDFEVITMISSKDMDSNKLAIGDKVKIIFPKLNWHIYE